MAIARALASNPGILLRDEATNALDPQKTTSILHLLKAALHKGSEPPLSRLRRSRRAEELRDVIEAKEDCICQRSNPKD